MNKINWPAVWREIAIAYDTPEDERTKRQYIITLMGFCHAMLLMGIDDSIPCQLNPKELSWFSDNSWCDDDAYDAIRATFAWLMVAMGDEFEDWLKWCNENWYMPYGNSV